MTRSSSPPSRRFSAAILPRLLLFFALAILACACALPSSALSAAKPLRGYGRQSWHTDSGLPQNTVHAVLQTHDGFLWIATEGGLVRFDGQDFRTFDTSNTPELHSNTINALTCDATGTLWISSADGLIRLTPDPLQPRFTRITTADGLPSNLVRAVLDRPAGPLILTSAGAALFNPQTNRATPLPTLTADFSPSLIAQGSNGQLWIATAAQLFFLAPAAITPNAIPLPPNLGAIQAIAATPQGELWIGTHDGITLLPRHGSPTLHLATPSVTALLTDATGLWVGTATGLSYATHGVLKPVPGPADPILSGRVLAFTRDRSGSVWAVYERGLARIPPGAASLQSPLVIPGVLTTFEDNEGNLWIGTDTDGLTVLRDQPFSTLTAADGLADDFLRAVFEDHAGNLWIGTNAAGLYQLPANTPDARPIPLQSLLHASPSLSSSVILALAETPQGLWIGTPDGLARLQNGRLTLFTTANGLPDDFVRSLFADTDGSLWIGTRNGLAHYARNAFTTYSRLDGLGADVIGAIVRTRAGKLWVGTLGGLSRFDGTGFTNFTRANGLAGDAITALHEDASGTLWIAANAAGLTRFRGDTFTPIPAPTLPQEIYSLLESNDSRNSNQQDAALWLGTSRGIDRIPLAALNAFADKRATTLPLETFGPADGMSVSECSSGGHPAACRRRDGSLWFATLKGAAFTQPADTSAPAPPRTAIEQVLVDDLQPSLSPTGDLTLPPGRSRLTLHYAGLSFTAPQKLHFRYRLEGFDKGWIDAGTRRTAFYTNLPPGHYRFLVAAANGSGPWTTAPPALRLTFQPRFYQTPWFYLLATAFLGLLGWLLYRTRVGSVRLQDQARYTAVLNERTRIAREIHDTLAQGYVGVSVQLELASRLLKSSPEVTPQSASQAALAQLERTQQFVRASLEDARSSIWNLRANPTAAQPGQAPEAVPETLPIRLATAIETRTSAPPGSGPSIRLEVHGASRPLAPHLEDELLRIAQEAIANAVRHANAANILVALTYLKEAESEVLHLDISDDGTGFPIPPNGAAPTGHYGIQGMRERAEAIDARFELRSQPGQGTIVEVALDLEPPAPSRA